MRQITFSKRIGFQGYDTGKIQHVVIAIDAGETAADAVGCLKASRDDWRQFYSADLDGQSALTEASKPKPLIQPSIEKLVAEAFDAPRNDKPFAYDVEAHIPHNWGIGDADLFDHLDPETRHLVREAIAHEDDAMDEALVDWAAFDDLRNREFNRSLHG